MHGRDFLDIAKNLSRSQFEASLRSAISRAYYALLNTAAQLLIDLGFSVEQGPGVHGQVRNRFFNDCSKEPLRSQIRTGIREYERKIGQHS